MIPVVALWQGLGIGKSCRRKHRTFLASANWRNSAQEGKEQTWESNLIQEAMTKFGKDSVGQADMTRFRQSLLGTPVGSPVVVLELKKSLKHVSFGEKHSGKKVNFVHRVETFNRVDRQAIHSENRPSIAKLLRSFCLGSSCPLEPHTHLPVLPTLDRVSDESHRGDSRARAKTGRHSAQKCHN